MNKSIRIALNSATKSIENTLEKISYSIVSLIRMMVLSRINVARKTKSHSKLKVNKNCIILANGPSLKEALANNEVLFDGKDVFAVNMFVQTKEFWTIKPRFYFIIDGAYFAPQTDRHKELIHTLKKAFDKVDWDMNLCISAGCIKGGLLNELNNPNIKIRQWNTTTFQGFSWLCHFMYRHNLAMPRCQTVTNMALVVAISMGYENVYLYGADHSWTKDLRVDEDNIVCYGDRHVYATDLNIIKLKYNIAKLLRQYANMFESHTIINHYAKTRQCKIWNCTKGSFIDAYDRIR